MLPVEPYFTDYLSSLAQDGIRESELRQAHALARAQVEGGGSTAEDADEQSPFVEPHVAKVVERLVGFYRGNICNAHDLEVQLNPEAALEAAIEALNASAATKALIRRIRDERLMGKLIIDIGGEEPSPKEDEDGGIQVIRSSKIDVDIPGNIKEASLQEMCYTLWHLIQQFSSGGHRVNLTLIEKDIMPMDVSEEGSDSFPRLADQSFPLQITRIEARKAGIPESRLIGNFQFKREWNYWEVTPGNGMASLIPWSLAEFLFIENSDPAIRFGGKSGGAQPVIFRRGPFGNTDGEPVLDGEGKFQLLFFCVHIDTPDALKKFVDLLNRGLQRLRVSESGLRVVGGEDGTSVQ